MVRNPNRPYSMKYPIYTRTGDTGETGLLGGRRIPKSDSLLDVLGTLDEAAAHIGLYRCYVRGTSLDTEAMTIQQDLLSLGSIVAGKSNLFFDVHERTHVTEKAIDRFMPDDQSQEFVLLGGKSKAGAECHIVRSVIRRLERRWIRHGTCLEYIPYINRLSDYFFVLASYCDSRFPDNTAK